MHKKISILPHVLFYNVTFIYASKILGGPILRKWLKIVGQMGFTWCFLGVLI